MEEKTLWRKCGNIIKNDDGTLIRCDSSPCGYYALFGIKHRSLNQDYTPANCSWYTTVFAAHVTDRKILWIDSDFMQSICLAVAQKKGLCSTKKGKFGCYTECFQWDDNGNCITEKEYCSYAEINVYNISGCFDDYSKFAEFFYAPCEITPDAEGNYPDIFGTYFNGMSDTAYTCINNYWSNYFKKNYCLSYKLNKYEMRSWWSENYMAGKYEIDRYYQCCDADGNVVYSGSQPCAENLTQCYYIESQGSQISEGILAYNYDDTSIEKYISYGADPVSGMANCCEKVNGTVYIPEVNAFIKTYAENKNTYYQYGLKQYTCTTSNNQCYSFQYRSGCSDNFYGSMMNCGYRFLWAKLKLQKTDYTPDGVTGVKFSVKMTHTRENTGLNRQQVITEETSFDLDLMFDVEYTDLPLATNINMMHYLEKPSCINGCDSWDTQGQWRVQPYVMFGWAGVTPYQQDCWYDGYKIELEAKEYIKGE